MSKDLQVYEEMLQLIGDMQITITMTNLMSDFRLVHFKKVANAMSFHGFRVEENYRLVLQCWKPNLISINPVSECIIAQRNFLNYQ